MEDSNVTAWFAKQRNCSIAAGNDVSATKWVTVMCDVDRNSDIGSKTGSNC